MRLLFIFVFSLYSFHFFAQNYTHAHIEYELFCNTSSPTKMFTTLAVNNNVAIYQEKYSTAQDWKEKTKPLSEGVKVFGGTEAADPYLKIDRNKKEVLFFASIGVNNFIVKDNYNEFVWNVSSETKSISGYNCIKATTSFRGREWIVWFSPDIPLSFGPWKLHGLPGLILEASDSTDKYTLKVVKIDYKKDDILNKDFSTLMQTKNSKPISFQQFLNDAEEARQNLYHKLNEDRGVTVTMMPVVREGEELRYEWEP